MKEIFMSKNKLRWFWYLWAIAALCLIGTMLYQPVGLSGTLYIVSLYIVVEAFIVAVVLSILRKTDMLASWKTAMYLAVVVAGILAISFLLSPVDGRNLLPFSLSVFTLFVFLNVVLSKIIFAINFWKACSIGTILGLINTLMIIIATPFSH